MNICAVLLKRYGNCWFTWSNSKARVTNPKLYSTRSSEYKAREAAQRYSVSFFCKSFVWIFRVPPFMWQALLWISASTCYVPVHISASVVTCDVCFTDTELHLHQGFPRFWWKLERKLRKTRRSNQRLHRSSAATILLRELVGTTMLPIKQQGLKRTCLSPKNES